MAKHPEYLNAIRERRYVASNDARTQSNTRELGEYLDTWHITSLLDAALYRNGLGVGIVCHEHVGPQREWKREECQFAATVADLLSYFLEVNDRLAAEAQSHALQLKLKDAHRLDALGEMEDSARHAATLVGQLMSLGRNKTPVAQKQQLDPVMVELERLIAAQTRPGVQVVFDIEKGLQLWAEAAQLQQVLFNLVANAQQAMRKGVVAVKARAKKGGVVFEVIDAGEGIAPEHLERLFDPFFTTRAEGHGIGLAVVQQLVKQHGGEVTVSSTVGDGSTFRVWWPSEV